MTSSAFYLSCSIQRFGEIYWQQIRLLKTLLLYIHRSCS